MQHPTKTIALVSLLALRAVISSNTTDGGADFQDGDANARLEPSQNFNIRTKLGDLHLGRITKVEAAEPRNGEVEVKVAYVLGCNEKFENIVHADLPREALAISKVGVGVVMSSKGHDCKGPDVP